MSFSGDSIVIKDDFTFERIENLKLGDSLLSPTGKEVIITKIEANYCENNFILKSTNFAPFYLGPDTEILISKQFELFDRDTNTFKSFIKEQEYLNIGNISPMSYLCLQELTLKNEKNFNNPWLYGLSLFDGEILKKEDKTLNLVNKNITNLIPKIRQSDENLNISKNKNLVYINNISYPWAIDMDCKIHQRKVNNELFFSKDEDIKIFLDTIIKHNTKMFINEKEFRCYNESKILCIQLFYLLSYLYKELPLLELIEKDRVEYKKTPQAHKKKRYSITMIQDNKTLIKDGFFLQEIERINSIKKNIKMYNIETLNNEPFYLNNIIVKK